MFSVIQSSRTLREAETKKGRCSVFRQRPFEVSRLLDVVAEAVFIARKHDAGPRFPEVRGKIGNSRAQPDFWQQNRRSRKHKTGVWSADLGFSPHFRNRSSEVCGKFLNHRARRHFFAKKPQVDALALLGMVDLFRFCRILPDLMSFILFWCACTNYRCS